MWNASDQEEAVKIDPRSFPNFARVLIGVIVPRPIALVSTVSSEGVVNLAPYSFFNAVAVSPPTVALGMARHADWKPKDTLANVEATGELVVNLVDDHIADAMNRTVAEHPSDVDEFEVAGLTPISSETVKPPRVGEEPVSMECRVSQIVTLGEGPQQTGLVIAEIVLLHARDDLIQEDGVVHMKLRPIGDLTGTMFCRTLDVFEMERAIYSPKT